MASIKSNFLRKGEDEAMMSPHVKRYLHNILMPFIFVSGKSLFGMISHAVNDVKCNTKTAQIKSELKI